MSTYEAILFQMQQGIRVDLKLISSEDTRSLHQLLSHQDVQPHIVVRSDRGTDYAQVEKLVNRMVYASDPCALHAGIFLKDTQQLIGMVALQNWNRREGKATLGYILDPAWWGHGYATEAVGLFLSYSVHHLGITRIEGRCRGDNHRSERVMIKNGMSLERVMQRVGSLEDVMKVFTLLHK